MERMSYWLHILELKSEGKVTPSGYLLALSRTPRRNAEGGAMPTATHPSWERLEELLSEFGMCEDALNHGRQELDAHSGYMIPELWLTAAQVRQLGFTLPTPLEAAAK